MQNLVEKSTLTEEEAHMNLQPELEGTRISPRGMHGQVGEVHEGPDTAVQHRI